MAHPAQDANVDTCSREGATNCRAFAVELPNVNECNGDVAIVTCRQDVVVCHQRVAHFLPDANLPSVAGATSLSSAPLVLPVMMGLFGIVSYA